MLSILLPFKFQNMGSFKNFNHTICKHVFCKENIIFSGHTRTHTHSTAPKADLRNVTEGRNHWLGLFTEWIIIPSWSLYCMCYPTEQTVAGFLVPLADRAASVGLQDLHIGPWCFKLAKARRWHGLYVRACGAGESVFHTRGDRRSPAWARRGETEGGPFWIPSSNSK